MKLPSLRTALFLACLPLLPGCNDPVSPSDELDDARRRWESMKLSTYSYTLQRSCECLPEYTRAARVHVVNGTVAAANYISDGSPVSRETRSTYPTIDGLFEIVEEAVKKQPAPHRLVVYYDRDFGYPTRFDVDYDRQMADDERIITARDLASVTAARVN